MKRIEKIASVCRKPQNLYVGRTSKDDYLVSDGFFEIKLDKERFQKFAMKWSSYKGNPVIPLDIERGEAYGYSKKIGGREFRELDEAFLDSMKNVLSIPDNDTPRVNKTKFLYESFRLFVLPAGGLMLVDTLFDDVLDLGHTYRARGPRCPLYVLNGDDDVVAVVMPVAPSHSFEKDILEVLTAGGDKEEASNVNKEEE